MADTKMNKPNETNDKNPQTMKNEPTGSQRQENPGGDFRPEQGQAGGQDRDKSAIGGQAGQTGSQTGQRTGQFEKEFDKNKERETNR